MHSRNAEIDTYEILKNEMKKSNLKILIHCFTGSKDFAHKLIDLNCYISVSGIITFNNSKELAETVASIPLNNLMVETDSPYLTPEAYKGQENEPAFVREIAKKIADVKHLTIEEVITSTTQTARRFFNIQD